MDRFADGLRRVLTAPKPKTIRHTANKSAKKKRRR
jgi:hypothetical protein